MRYCAISTCKQTLWNSSRRLCNTFKLKIKAQWSFKKPVTIYQWTPQKTDLHTLYSFYIPG